MLKLKYTQSDLTSNNLLQNTIQTLLMLGANVEKWALLVFNWDFKLDNGLLSFVQSYKCMIKMPFADWNWNVYNWLSENTQTFSEWKADSFTDPISDKDWSFVYVPSDIVGRYLTWKELNIFLTNWCELLTISEYKEWYRKEYPDKDLN